MTISLKTFTHFKAHFIQYVNDLLVVLLPRALLCCQSLTNLVQLLRKILNFIHLLQCVQSVHDLRLKLIPLQLVRLQKQLHLADKGLLLAVPLLCLQQLCLLDVLE